MRRKMHRQNLRLIMALVALMMPSVAWAGPPFMTDDPEPTDTGHWEIYGPMVDMEGAGSDYEGAAGVEVNYGAAPDLQLTVGVPVAFVHAEGDTQTGLGDLELSAKYRFYHDEKAGVSVAFFPGMSLPTGTNGMSGGKVTGFLPIWAQKDMGNWSVFGGGGYNINPGAGNRDYWSGGVALTHSFGDTVIGVEADRHGPSADDGRASTSLGLGFIQPLGGPFRILASGGPTFNDGPGKTGYHVFFAIGADF